MRAPQALFSTGKHSQKQESSKCHWKMEPVAGLDGLHLAGNMAKEGGHVPLSWELTFISPFSVKATSLSSETTNGIK